MMMPVPYREIDFFYPISRAYRSKPKTFNTALVIIALTPAIYLHSKLRQKTTKLLLKSRPKSTQSASTPDFSSEGLKNPSVPLAI